MTPDQAWGLPGTAGVSPASSKERAGETPAVPGFAAGRLAENILYFARALRKAAVSLDSQALASDAEHFANDMFGALAVIAGLGVVALHRFIALPDWLVGRADAIAALTVAIIAFRSVWTLGSEAVRALMDDVPAELTERLKKRVESIDGVVHGTAIVRTRFVGNRPFVEVKLGTQRGT